MDIDPIFAAGRFGLAYERLRLEVASHNISIANTPVVEGSGLRPLRVNMTAGSFSEHLDNASPAATDVQAFRLVNDPSNPLADSDGNVRFPDVNMADEMTTLVSASRSYEANVRAMNSLREMLLKALEIGK